MHYVFRSAARKLWIPTFISEIECTSDFDLGTSNYGMWGLFSILNGRQIPNSAAQNIERGVHFH